jgi:LacI family transcriptional regulator
MKRRRAAQPPPPPRPRRARVVVLTYWHEHSLLLGISRYARQANWIMDLTMVMSGSVPAHWHGDGILSVHGGNVGLIGRILQENVPTVDMGCPDPRLAVPHVLPDGRLIGRLAGEHLAGRGFQTIGFVGQSDNLMGQERRAGLEAVAREQGRAFRVFQPRDIARRLRGTPLPVGLMAENDLEALRLLYLCEQAGLHVPEEVAIIGVDNDELQIATAAVPLTSVDTDAEGTGYAAAELLDRLMAGAPPPAVPIRIPPRGVVVRASTNVLAIPHVPAARALRCLWDRYREPLDLEAIAAEAGLCRRRLEDAFKRHVGRSMAQEVRRLRLAEARRRLLETRDKVRLIAQDVGFSDTPHLTKVFRREFGVTPSVFRRRGGVPRDRTSRAGKTSG